VRARERGVDRQTRQFLPWRLHARARIEDDAEAQRALVAIEECDLLFDAVLADAEVRGRQLADRLLGIAPAHGERDDAEVGGRPERLSGRCDGEGRDAGGYQEHSHVCQRGL
jgi:hypothetical protein